MYGALGAQTSRSAQPALFTAVASAYDVHRSRRDLLIREIAALGARPAAAAAPLRAAPTARPAPGR